MGRAVVMLAAVAALVLASCSDGDDAGAPATTAPGDLAAEWITGADAPTARQEVAAAVIDGRIWVVGGFVDGAASALVEVYDPETDTWDRGAPISRIPSTTPWPLSSTGCST